MNVIQQLSKFTKLVLCISLILIIYGYLCRIIGIYFFWESNSVGWSLLFVGIISFLSNRIKNKKAEKKKSLIEKIGIGILIFVLMLQIIIISIIPFTDAYTVTKGYLLTDTKLKSEVGNISGFSLKPMGSIQKESTANGEQGIAVINLIVKGDKAFKDISVLVVKNIDSDGWKVIAIE